MQKQEQTTQDPRLAVIGGTNDNIGQKPVQVVVKCGVENPEEASKNSGSDWVISIEGKLKQAREHELKKAREHDAAISCSKPCIYKVSRFLRNGDDKAFKPLNVSLGPYHHGNEDLRQMDHHKWRFLNRVLVRTHQDIKVYLDSVREVEETARSCYEGSFPALSSNEFVEMMVLDGCFVLELFRGADEGFEKLGYPRNDPIFARFNLIDSIKRDMIMLENQLPLFILDRLLKLQYLGCRCPKDVAELAVTFFEALIPTGPSFNETFDPRSDAGLHCLEILWRSRFGGSNPDPLHIKRLLPKIRHEVIHCATELKDSGIKFKKRNADRFWDIEFKNGVLWIPQLLIDDSTKSLFLNLIAFEQCHFGCGNYITSYVLFMDNLIKSSMDVAHLHSCGIIEHWLGSDSEVADLFNRLCHGVVIDTGDNYHSQLSTNVNNYLSQLSTNVMLENISIQGKLKQAGEDDDATSISWSNLCIYKVPHSLRNGDDKAFVPMNVSLGPYHNDKKRPLQMDHHKWRFLRRVLERTKQDIKVYLDSVREVEEKARSCYEGPIPLSSNEFVEMMVLDGCFVLELFRAVDEGFVTLGYPTNDPIFTRTASIISIKRDMIMLENQLPLFILDRLLKLQLGCHLQKDVAKLAVQFLMATHQSFLGKIAFYPPSDAGLHCLEILWRIFLGGPKPNLQSQNSDVADKVQLQVIYCATELKASGIKFKMLKADRFWDIKFENGVLWIPRLSIGDETKSFFLNLIAFEQCHFGCGNYITSYVLFMDNLINSPMDVAHLHSCGIIEHWLGSDSEVADLFNRLCHGVHINPGDNNLSQLSTNVNNYHNRRWNTWKATFKHKYLNSPWAIISVIAAVVLLLLTFMQTFYGVYAYYRPSS